MKEFLGIDPETVKARAGSKTLTRDIRETFREYLTEHTQFSLGLTGRTEIING